MTRQNRCYRSAQRTHLPMRVHRSPPSGPWVLTHQKWHRSCWGLVLGPSVQSCISQPIASCSTQPVEAEIAPSKSPTRCGSRCVLRGETIRELIPRRAKTSFSRSSCARLCTYCRCVTPRSCFPSLFDLPVLIFDPSPPGSATHVLSIRLYRATLRRSMRVQ